MFLLSAALELNCYWKNKMQNIATAWLMFCAYALVTATIVIPLTVLVERFLERRRERNENRRLVVWK